MLTATAPTTTIAAQSHRGHNVVAEPTVEEIMAVAMAAHDAKGSRGPVSVPATAKGLQAITELTQVGLVVAATGVTTTSQGMLASLAGAQFIELDLDDLAAAGKNPLEAVASLAAMLLVTESPSSVLVTGWRDAATAAAAELAGGIAAPQNW